MTGVKTVTAAPPSAVSRLSRTFDLSYRGPAGPRAERGEYARIGVIESLHLRFSLSSSHMERGLTPAGRPKPATNSGENITTQNHAALKAKNAHSRGLRLSLQTAPASQQRVPIEHELLHVAS